MEYQKLAERLRAYTYWLGKDEPCSRDIHPPICDEAADAISVLLAGSKTLEMFAEATNGVPLNRVREITEAERGGRVVLLPCKVTDTVYIVETVFENGKQKKRNKPSGERVVSAQIDHVTIGGTTGKPVYDLCSETGNWYYSLEPGEFYLTREEAEATIAERGDHT